ncbi:hypothetical protein M885DRAFT_615331 [Pelagophyceae sp. CCMP2097]|nr:hypothetical protein M885DRAFT_615331 [Pelagophyceae sp. CCMP2097]
MAGFDGGSMASLLASLRTDLESSAALDKEVAAAWATYNGTVNDFDDAKDCFDDARAYAEIRHEAPYAPPQPPSAAPPQPPQSSARPPPLPPTPNPPLSESWLDLDALEHHPNARQPSDAAPSGAAGRRRDAAPAAEEPQAGGDALPVADDATARADDADARADARLVLIERKALQLDAMIRRGAAAEELRALHSEIDVLMAEADADNLAER